MTLAQPHRIERTSYGGDAPGAGNPAPDYVPDKNYFAVIGAAMEMRA